MSHTEIDLSNADPELLQEYRDLDTEIDAWVKEHPGQLSEDEHVELRALLSRRAKLMSEILNHKVDTAF